MVERVRLCEIMEKSSEYLGGDTFDYGRELGLSAAETSQLFNWFVSMLRHQEDQFFSDLPETDRLSLESQMQSIKSLAYYPKLWELTKHQFNSRFREYADDLVPEGVGEAN